jgi:hypothetical protein
MNERQFRMKMPMWRSAAVERVDDEPRTVVVGTAENVTLKPGTYRLRL